MLKYLGLLLCTGSAAMVGAIFGGRIGAGLFAMIGIFLFGIIAGGKRNVE